MHQVITIAVELPPHHVLVISVVLVHWTVVVCGGPELVDCLCRDQLEVSTESWCTPDSVH